MQPQVEEEKDKIDQGAEVAVEVVAQAKPLSKEAMPLHSKAARGATEVAAPTKKQARLLNLWGSLDSTTT